MLRGIPNTVLLIEADRSLRRLITLGLQYRGLHVIEDSSSTNIPALQLQHPDLVVLDIDSEVGTNLSLLSTFQSHPFFSTIPLIILAWDCPVISGNHRDRSQASITYLAKPFDARTLHTTIEQLQSTSKVNISTSRQEQLLAHRSVTPTPSIWPLITAAGLLLALIGLMTQITISALGLLVMLIALLVWSLSTKPEPLAV